MHLCIKVPVKQFRRWTTVMHPKAFTMLKPLTFQSRTPLIILAALFLHVVKLEKNRLCRLYIVVSSGIARYAILQKKKKKKTKKKK